MDLISSASSLKSFLSLMLFSYSSVSAVDRSVRIFVSFFSFSTARSFFLISSLMTARRSPMNLFVFVPRVFFSFRDASL